MGNTIASYAFHNGWSKMVCPFAEWLLQVAQFFDATIEKGADVKLAANWIMGDIAAYMKNEKLTINEIKLTATELAELIASITGATISGKIGKEVKACFCCCYYLLSNFFRNEVFYLITLVEDCPLGFRYYFVWSLMWLVPMYALFSTSVSVVWLW